MRGRATNRQNIQPVMGVLALIDALFFGVYADPLIEQSDDEILCRLEFHTDKGFCVLRGDVQ